MQTNLLIWQVPDYWKRYVHEVDQEREMWLNSFYKACLLSFHTGGRMVSSLSLSFSSLYDKFSFWLVV